MKKLLFFLIIPFLSIGQQLNTENIFYDGHNREYIIYIPQTYSSSNPEPILFAFHGGSGYADDDTLTVDGGAEVELNIQDGFIVGANVVNGGFGFTKLPDLTINSDTGAGARLLPVLKFTKIDDATQLADTNVPFDRTLSQDVVVTVISCIEK